MTEPTKTCSRCHETKVVTDFYRRSPQAHLRVSHCKSCMSIKQKKYYQLNRARISDAGKVYRSNPATLKIIRERNRLWQSNNVDYVNRKRRMWAKENPKKHSASVQKWRRKNRDKLLPKRRAKTRARYASDVNFKITCVLRSRLSTMIRQRGVKYTSAADLLGCDVSDLIKYLEQRFDSGMTWENHSPLGWHIDHVVPCSAFDMTDQVEQRQCFHYTNLQPMWGVENLKKGGYRGT